MKRLETAAHGGTNLLLIAPLVVAVVCIAVVKLADGVSALAQQGGRDEVRLELSSNGFTPLEVQHAPGTFAIAVENKTLSGEYTLRLKAEDGTVLSEVQVQKGSSAWSVSLQTGKYTGRKSQGLSCENAQIWS